MIERAEASPGGWPTGMTRDFGWFFHALGMGYFLGRVKMPDAAAERIRAAAETGPVVYVLHRASTFDALALHVQLRARGLPLAVWSNGKTSAWWLPLAAAWRAITRAASAWGTDALASGWVRDQVAAGRPIAIFLERRAWWRTAADPLPALLDAQARSERPIQLLPVVVAWDKAPSRANPGVRDFLFDAAPVPEAFGGLGRAWTRSQGASIQVGEPLDLQAFCERFAPELRARALGTVLRRQVHREAETVRGPRLIPYETMRRMVLDNPAMTALAESEATRLGTRPDQVRARMEKDYRSIAAHFQWWVIRWLAFLLSPLWTRVFSGVDLRPEELERIRSAMRSGTVVLVPCHKSHLDYVLLSWVFFDKDLALPHIVAGVNLAIWPVSVLLRGAGAFFVKRSFGDDRVFPAVFSRYLRELIRMGYPVEFFIEGGRTRSGKLMPPKLGVLGMVLDAAALRKHGREVTLLPIALAYEQVAEEGVYARELGGAPKTAESMGELVKARSILFRRYGRVYLRVGEPIAASAVVDRTADQPAWADRDRDDAKRALQALGERIVHRIGRVTVLLPTSLVAAALLSHHRRGLRAPELAARVARFRSFLAREGVEEAASFQWPEQAVAQALDRFARARRIEAHEAEGQRVWSILPNERITLAFYQNQILHAFAPAALATAAIRGLPHETFSSDDLLPGFDALRTLFRREFVQDPDVGAAEALGRALDALAAYGAIAPTDTGWRVGDTERLAELLGLIRPLLEAYALVARSGGVLGRGGVDRDALAKALMAERDGLLHTGVISRPEALSLVNLQNAIATLGEDGVLAGGKGPLALAPEAQAALLAWFAPMVD